MFFGFFVAWLWTVFNIHSYSYINRGPWRNFRYDNFRKWWSLPISCNVINYSEYRKTLSGVYCWGTQIKYEFIFASWQYNPCLKIHGQYLMHPIIFRHTIKFWGRIITISQKTEIKIFFELKKKTELQIRYLNIKLSS